MSHRKPRNLRSFREYIDRKRGTYKVLVNNYGERLQSDQSLMIGIFSGLICSSVFFICLMNILSGHIGLLNFIFTFAGFIGLNISRKIISLGFTN
jgi:hypothetical protein